jgi:hypothetical protein
VFDKNIAAPFSGSSWRVVIVGSHAFEAEYTSGSRWVHVAPRLLVSWLHARHPRLVRCHVCVSGCVGVSVRVVSRCCVCSASCSCRRVVVIVVGVVVSVVGAVCIGWLMVLVDRDRANAAAKDAAAAVSRTQAAVLNFVSHELRNPLHALKVGCVLHDLCGVAGCCGVLWCAAYVACVACVFCCVCCSCRVCRRLNAPVGSGSAVTTVLLGAADDTGHVP